MKARQTTLDQMVDGERAAGGSGARLGIDTQYLLEPCSYQPQVFPGSLNKAADFQREHDPWLISVRHLERPRGTNTLHHPFGSDKTLRVSSTSSTPPPDPSKPQQHSVSLCADLMFPPPLASHLLFWPPPVTPHLAYFLTSFTFTPVCLAFLETFPGKS